jgi:hypothetical protein
MASVREQGDEYLSHMACSCLPRCVSENQSNQFNTAKYRDFFTLFPSWFPLSVFISENDLTSFEIGMSRIASAIPVYVFEVYDSFPRNKNYSY